MAHTIARHATPILTGRVRIKGNWRHRWAIHRGQWYEYCPHWTGITLTLWPEGISSARTDHLFQEGLVLLIWRRRAKRGRSFAKEVGMGNPAEENDRAPN